MKVNNPIEIKFPFNVNSEYEYIFMVNRLEKLGYKKTIKNLTEKWITYTFSDYSIVFHGDQINFKVDGSYTYATKEELIACVEVIKEMEVE